MGYKDFVLKNERFLSKIYRLLFNTKCCFLGASNKVFFGNAFAKNNKFNIKGKNNIIRFTSGGLTRVQNCKFLIFGSHNNIIIHGHVVLKGVTFYIENDHNTIEIFDDSYINHDVELAASEGTRIIIGKGSLFSSCIIVRTHDSHAVLDANSHLRINRPKDVIIGNHVWIGNGVTILKGSTIGEDCVVSTKSVLTGKVYPPRSIIAGNPGEIKKQGITWDTNRNVPFAE